jgi:hypothetical protein
LIIDEQHEAADAMRHLFRSRAMFARVEMKTPASAGVKADHWC